MEEIETGSETTESGASEGSSSEASNSGSDRGSDNDSKLSSGQENKPTETTPFHEHPRFKELVEQKNEALRRHQEMDSRYKALEQQLNSFKESQPKAPTEFDQLIKDLKQVDPRLASALEAQAKAAKTSEELQKRLDAFERNSQESARSSQVQNAVAKINQLHESNKVSPEIKQIINDKLDLLYMQGKLNFQNLEATYKEQHGAIKKYEEALTRSIRESYVKDKTKDATVPASVPKGAPAKAQQKSFTPPKSRDELRSAVVKSFLKEQTAAKAATNS